MKTIEELKKGDIVTYRNKRKNNVNKPDKYMEYYDEEFKNKELSKKYDIMKIQRYKKILFVYIKKTIYKRNK